MAPETYYYIFSNIAVMAILLHTSNMIFFKIKHKTLIGNKYEPSTPQYKKLLSYSSPKALALAGIAGLLFIGNLIYDIHRILNLGNPEYAHFILPFAPLVIAAITVGAIIQSRSMFGKKD